ARRREWAEFIGNRDGRGQRHPVPLPVYIVQRLRLEGPHWMMGRGPNVCWFVQGGEGPAFSWREHGEAHQTQIGEFLVRRGRQLLLRPAASCEVRDEWAVMVTTNRVPIGVRPHHPRVVRSGERDAIQRRADRAHLL